MLGVMGLGVMGLGVRFRADKPKTRQAKRQDKLTNSGGAGLGLGVSFGIGVGLGVCFDC